MTDLEGDVVLVTGAGRGLGRAYARLFAAHGAIVIVHDAGVDAVGRGGDRSIADSTVEEIKAAGGTAYPAYEDIGDRDDCDALIENVLTKRSRLDALVLSAGLVPIASLAETTPIQYERIMRVNVDAAFWLSRAAMPAMKAQRYGRIVLTVSGHGLYVTGAVDLTLYGMTKGALFGLMNMLAAEGAPEVLVNAVSPVAATRVLRRTVAPGTFTPEQVAPAVVALASRACPTTGVVLTAANGFFRVGRYGRTPGIDLGPAPTVSGLLERWGEVVSDAWQPAEPG